MSLFLKILATTFGIALPKWIVSKEYGVWVLAFYGFVLMILLPSAVVCFSLKILFVSFFKTFFFAFRGYKLEYFRAFGGIIQLNIVLIRF